MKLWLKGSAIPIVQINPQVNIYCPPHLVAEVGNWMANLVPIQRLLGDRMLITSIKSSLTGEIRSGSSHPNGWAIDVTFPDRWIHEDINPRFDNDLRLMWGLASLEMNDVMIAVESDHLHIERTKILPGVYIYASMRPEFYTSDVLRQPRTIKDGTLISVTPVSIYLDPAIDGKMIKQRQLTDSTICKM